VTHDPSPLDATDVATPSTLPGDGVVVRRKEGDRLVRGDLLGRYVVIDRIGAGGMGVVYAAYDPDLDRKVAVKLMLPREHASADARARLLREAQALAKLDHPHVVAIHDVGTHGESVYLAMEFVEGQTLAAWRTATERSWREILARIVAAGEGLAAAHDKGLVHRDIKPDNIMVGADDRVRVLDFGLARADRDAPEAGRDPVEGIARGPSTLNSQLTRTGSMMGTPAYMAPEQFSAEPVDARSDQFSLCATAWEALYGQRPFAGQSLAALANNVIEGKLEAPPAGNRVPAWLRRVLERGLQRRPDDRFADMRALLRALRADPTRKRWLLAGTMGIAAIAMGSYAITQVSQQRAVATCEAAGAVIDRDWNDEAESELERAMLATNQPYAATTFAKTVPWIDRWAESWREARVAACRAHSIEATWDADLHARADDCLEEARGNFVALVAELSDADAAMLARATSAVAKLPSLDACTSPERLRERPSLDPEQRDAVLAVRAQLARAASLSVAGNYAEGLIVAREAVIMARATGWPTVIAQAEHRVGMLEERSAHYAESEASLLRALAAAREAQSISETLEIATRLVMVVGYYRDRPAEGKVWAEFAQTQLALLSSDHPLEEARLASNLALVHQVMGEHDEAVRLHTRALAIQEAALGEHHPEVAATLNNLGVVQQLAGNYDEAIPLYTRSVAMQIAALGESHPVVAGSLANLATIRMRRHEYDEALALYERALAIQQATLDENHPELAATLNDLADAHAKKRNHAEALRLYSRALAIWETALGPDDPEVARALQGLGDTALAQGRPADGVALLERALKLREETSSAERVGKSRFSLARCLWETEIDRPRARALAELARADFAGIPDEEKMREVDDWLAAHR
jgi:tetratricopeptide (TPR) repeat protein/predicted Ser/Thr protein kinase